MIVALFVDALKGVGGPDLLPVGLGERREGQHLGSGAVHERPGFGEAGGKLVSDLVPGVEHGLGVGLSEDGSEQRRRRSQGAATAPSIASWPS